MTDLHAAWDALKAAARNDASGRIESLFAAEPGRLEAMTVSGGGLTLDLSKQPWSLAEGLPAALALARAAGVEAARDRLFAGEAVNVSEDRAVLHPALRAPDGDSYSAKGETVSSQVEAGRAAMADFAAKVRSGTLKGATGKPFTAILHIGIGGSDLGPRLVWEALRPLRPAIDLRFVANVDGADFAVQSADLDPATTLVVAVSKTFTTLETLANATAARDWLRASLGDAGDSQLVAVSANPKAAMEFGVAEDRIFAFWDWVGGRYSIWSAVGLSCAVALGWEAFEGFLAGAAAMDKHFQNAPLDANLPVLLALAHVFNRNGLGRGARAVSPYAQRLRLLANYLQQLEMESNGKRVSTDGSLAANETATVVFGDAGTNGQHAFYQLLHQGTDIIPVDIVAVAKITEGPPGMHAKLLANAIAQAEALMIGRGEGEVRVELSKRGSSPQISTPWRLSAPSPAIARPASSCWRTSPHRASAP